MNRSAAPIWARRIYAGLLVLIGIVLVTMGGELVALGGSPYYVFAGLLVIIAGVLIWRGDRRGGMIYAAMLAGTLGWSLWEAGADPWALVARLVAPTVLGLPLISVWLMRRGGPRLLAGATAGLLVATTALCIFLSSSGIDDSGEAAPAASLIAADGVGDWAHFGRTHPGTRFAPFAEISRGNN